MAGSAAALTIAAMPVQKVTSALVLTIDASASIDYKDYVLQRDSYAAAFQHYSVFDTISLTGGIAVMVLDWDERGFIRIPWTRLSTAEDCLLFASQVSRILPPMPKSNLYGSDYGFGQGAGPGRSQLNTSIEVAIKYSHLMFHKCPWLYDRAVIDISGDGQQNINTAFASLAYVRDRAIAAGITINGIAIPVSGSVDNYDLLDYYHTKVIGGHGAFALSATTPKDFMLAMRRKISQELV